MHLSPPPPYLLFSLLSTLTLSLSLLFHPVIVPAPHAGPLRGRRIDWPAATAADPGKNTWDSDRRRRLHVFSTWGSARQRRRHVLRHGV